MISLWEINFHDELNDVEVRIRIPDETEGWAYSRAQERLAGPEDRVPSPRYTVTTKRIGKYRASN